MLPLRRSRGGILPWVSANPIRAVSMLLLFIAAVSIVMPLIMLHNVPTETLNNRGDGFTLQIGNPGNPGNGDVKVANGMGTLSETKVTTTEDAVQQMISAYPDSSTTANNTGALASSGGGTADVQKQQAVKDAFIFAYDAYADKCFGKDEFQPVTKKCNDWLGAGLTIVDSLDTMWIMGLHDRFDRGRDWVADNLHFDFSKPISFFETTIRIVGGLLSAFELSHDRMFLDKAQALTDKLMVVFDTKSGLPLTQVNLAKGTASNVAWTKKASLLAEVGTIQMEFAYLSKYTGDPKYFDAADKVIDILDDLEKEHPGLYPIYIKPDTGKFSNNLISWGAMGDSFYEYLLKTWLLLGKPDNNHYYKMYKESVVGLSKELLTERNGYTYIADLKKGKKLHKMDHLACFIPGLLALGQAEGAGDNANDLEVAEKLLNTCWESYKQMPSGLGPEYMRFEKGLSVGEPAYHLRPETVESMMILWRITKKPIYREMGWKVFQSLEKHCKIASGGYSGLKDVRKPKQKDDRMESFFLAETLKYLYLLFSDDELIPIVGPNAYVFNTESHPLRRWQAE